MVRIRHLRRGGQLIATDVTATRCPLLVYMTLPPLPYGTSLEAIRRYDEEMHRPSGIGSSIPRPPEYWEGIGLAGVAVADECGFALGFEKGTGVKIDQFWRKSVNCQSTSSQVPCNADPPRRRLRDSIPTARPLSSRPTDGVHPDAVHPCKSFALEYRHHGHCRFVDILGTRRYRHHVG